MAMAMAMVDSLRFNDRAVACGLALIAKFVAKVCKSQRDSKRE